MGITVSIKRPKLPEWVNEAYKKLEPEEIEQLVKILIYIEMKPCDKGYEISKGLQAGANRVSVLDTIEHCLWALGVTLDIAAWSVMKDRNEIQSQPDVDIDKTG